MSTPKKYTKSANESTMKKTGKTENGTKDSSLFPSTPFQKFLINHLHKKTESSDTITNTRI